MSSLTSSSNPLSSPTTIQQSLKEIASLLLLLHEHYLKDSNGDSNILSSLMTLISDSGLLKIISILDCEKIRRSVMKDSKEDKETSHLGYELFYDWLRLIGQLVFKDDCINSKLALHHLLTNYILPFATQIGSQSSDKRDDKTPLLKNSTLKIVSEYSNFLLYWYFSIISNGQSLSFNYSIDIWSEICNQSEDGVITDQNQIIESFIKYDIIPGFISKDQLLKILEKYERDNVKKTIYISFSHFLKLLEEISENCEYKISFNMLRPMSGNNSDNQNELSLKFVLLLKKVSEKALSYIISNFITRNDDNIPDNKVSASSLLWLLRQSWFYLLAPFEMGWLVNQIENYSDPIDFASVSLESQSPLSIYSSDNSFREIKSRRICLSTEKLAYILYRIVEKCSDLPLSSITSTINLPSTDRYCLYLACYTPSLLFASPIVSPPPLEIFYNVSFVLKLQAYQKDIDALFSSIGNDKFIVDCSSTSFLYAERLSLKYFEKSINQVMVQSSVISLSSLLEFLCAYVHRDINMDYLSNVVSAVIGFQLQQTNYMIPKGFLMEILFIISQDDDIIQKIKSKTKTNIIEDRFGKKDKYARQVDNFLILLRSYLYKDETTERREYDINISSNLNKKFNDASMQSNGDQDSEKIDKFNRLPNSLNNTLDDNNDNKVKLYSKNGVVIESVNNSSESFFAGVTVSRNNENTVFTPTISMTTSAPLSNGNLNNNDNNNNNNNNIDTEHSVDSNQLRDVIVLLMHYPLNSFHLNPWDVLKLSIPTKNDIQKDSNSISGISVNNNLLYEESKSSNNYSDENKPLTNFLKKFSDQYKVSSECLSAFFANYYIQDSDTESAVPTVRSMLKEDAMKSSLYDLLLTERSLRLLYLNFDLLKFIYSRCLSKFKVSNEPLTEGLLTPLLTNVTMENKPNNALISYSCAINWARNNTKLSIEEIKIHLNKLSCIMSKYNDYLTFCTFIIFAVMCFTSKDSLLAGREDLFADDIRHMLHNLSLPLTNIQKSLRMRILDSLFSSDANVKRANIIDRNSILTVTLTYFNNCMSSNTANNKNLPPRPPLVLWDAPRFVNFCKHCGLLGHINISIEVAWVAFGLFLKNSNIITNNVWDKNVISPLPIKIDMNSLNKIIDFLLWTIDSSDSNSSKQSKEINYNSIDILYNKLLTPIISSYSDFVLTANNPMSRVDDLSLEDVLRFGGSECMSSLMDAQEFLITSYEMLLETSLHSFHPLHMDTSDSMSYMECSLNIICRYFSCNDILRAGAIAVQAKRSLYFRLRPAVVNNNSNSSKNNTFPLAEIVTLSYSEFEELFIRCAYLSWDTWSTSSNLKDVLLKQQQQDPLSIYLREVLKGKSKANYEKNSSLKQSWGTDFIKPYLSVLQYLNIENLNAYQVRENNIQSDFNNRDDEFIPHSESMSPTSMRERLNTLMENNGEKLAEFIKKHIDKYGSLHDIEMNSVSNESNKSDAVLSDLLTSRLSYSIADPAIRRKDSLSSIDEVINQTATITSNYNNIGPSQSTPTSNASLSTTSSKYRSANIKPTSLSYNNNFIVALDALLAGTKEGLWPVYATYCSCGDSLDPGKLSGPNLFSLLSKLGVLSDKTLLSDIGILLHQVSKGPLATNTMSLKSQDRPQDTNPLESPSLSFEEFMVFLYAFSELRFEGVMISPTFIDDNKPNTDSEKRSSSKSNDGWFSKWLDLMGSSASFRHLLQDCVLPLLKRQTLLAFPEDARLRDKFSCVFSLEVLQCIEGAEGPLQSFFESERDNGEPMVSDDPMKSRDVEIHMIMTVLKRINLVPTVINEPQVAQLIKDVMPEDVISKRRFKDYNGNNIEQSHVNKPFLLFPQWEWVLAVVAFQAVETAIKHSTVYTDPQKIPSLVASVITSIASAITQYVNK